MKFPQPDFCEICVPGKNLKKPFPKENNYKATQKLEKVYSDIIGPVNSSSLVGNRYAINFIAEFSSYAVEKLMKYKTQALQIFKEYAAQYGRPKI